MQKIATKVFIIASITFGMIGLLFILTSPGPDAKGSDLNTTLLKCLFATVFVILPSFALSVASKYLNSKS